jgi:hypothetical protein
MWLLEDASRSTLLDILEKGEDVHRRAWPHGKLEDEATRVAIE